MQSSSDYSELSLKNPEYSGFSLEFSKLNWSFSEYSELVNIFSFYLLKNTIYSKNEFGILQVKLEFLEK